MRIQSIGLEHHREAAFGRRRFSHVDAVNADVAAGCFFQTRDQAQQRGLTTTGRSDEHNELAVFDGQIQRRDNLSVAKALVDFVESNTSHDPFLISLRQRSSLGPIVSDRTSPTR